jgi:DUF4097 and DUF4098 domain-containing protein YvlB
MVAGGAGALIVASLSGCNVVPGKQFRDERTMAGSIATVNITGGSGSVTISGASSDGSIHVKRRVWYRDGKPGAADSVQGDTLTLNTSCGPNCSVDYEVTAPRALRVSGHNGSGDLSLTDIATASVEVGSGTITIRRASGDVTVGAGSGDIDVADVAGSVTGRTGSGNVRLAGVAGAATVETGSGDIDASDLRGSRTKAHTGSGNATLALAGAQDVDADTDSGNVHLTVPSGQSYRVTATTRSGDSDVRVPNDPSAAHLIKLHTGSGNVTVEPR